MNKMMILTISVFIISGCAQTTGYKPAIDTYGNPRSMYIQQDDMDCQRIAADNAGVGKNAMTDGLVGGLLGAAGGAAIGAVIGNPATGAALGAAAGGVGGIAKGGIQGDDAYKRIYRQCMRGRGHRVLD